jgi:hypothetical protein
MRKLLFAFSMALLILSALLTAALWHRPDSFLSVVALFGSSEEQFIEQKIILESPEVIDEVSQKYFSVGSGEFLDGRMSAQLVTEQGRIVPFIALKIKARSAGEASQISQEIIANFISSAGAEYNNQDKLFVLDDEEKAINSYLGAVEIRSAKTAEAIEQSYSELKKLAESGASDYRIKKELQRVKRSISRPANVSAVLGSLAEESGRPAVGVDERLQKQENIELLFAELESNASFNHASALLDLRKKLSIARIERIEINKQLGVQEHWIKKVSGPRLANPSSSVIKVSGGAANVAEAKRLLEKARFEEYMPGRPFLVVYADGKTEEGARDANENLLGALFEQSVLLHNSDAVLLMKKLALKDSEISILENEIKESEEKLVFPDDASSLKAFLRDCRSRLLEIELERVSEKKYSVGMIKKAEESLSPRNPVRAVLIMFLASVSAVLLFVSTARKSVVQPHFESIACVSPVNVAPVAHKNVVFGATQMRDIANYDELTGKHINSFPDEAELAEKAEGKILEDIKRKLH